MSYQEEKTLIRFFFVVDKEYEDVTAICPDDDTCYSHIGQHSSYVPEYVRENTRPATEEEYKPLLKELTELIEYDVTVLSFEDVISSLSLNKVIERAEQGLKSFFNVTPVELSMDQESFSRRYKVSLDETSIDVRLRYNLSDYKVYKIEF